MKLKLSNKTFYKNHASNINRYTVNGDYHHFVGDSNSYFQNDENTSLLSTSLNIKKQHKLSSSVETIIFTDYFESSKNIHELLKETKALLKPQGKLIVSVTNFRYSFFIKFLENIGFKKKSPQLSQIHENHIRNLAQTTGLEFVSSYTKQIIPFHVFGILSFSNFLLEAIFSKFNLGLIRYIVFKNNETLSDNVYTKTVIVPAKNEEGNIPKLFQEFEKLDVDEIVFSVGKSSDKTEEVINEYIENHKNLNVILHKQSKNGKANAIWESFEHVTSEVIAILDADISVEPFELKNFFEIIDNNYADFVNGTRLIYPMEKESMRKLNLVGNRVFQRIVSFITNTKLSDSLCGTKVFKKEFIQKIFWWQKQYELFDPFCDFDLLFTAAYTGEKIVEYPIHYKSRTYGKTQISRFRDGFKLIVYLINSYFIFHTSKKYRS